VPVDEVVTLREAAERLGVHYMTAYSYVRTGRLVARRDGREWRVAARDIATFLRGDSQRPRKHDGAARLAGRLLDGDEPGAWRIVEAALVGGHEPEAVHCDLVIPALRRIGDKWERGQIGVGDEHRATAVAQRMAARLGPRFARRGHPRGTVVLGCVAGERHGLASMLLADLLRGRRFGAVDLGADTPPECFVEAARDAVRPVAVVIGAIGAGHEATVATTLDALRAGGVALPRLVGGSGIADAASARRLGADGFTGHDAQSALSALEALMDARS
jgi:excisionase family DNA binding protein